jgi:hypothetical protein
MIAVFVGQQLKITWTCKDSVTGSVIDLSGETVKIHIKPPSGIESEVAAVVEDVDGGVVSYTWAVDSLVEGEYLAKPYFTGSKTPGTAYRFTVEHKWRK